MSDKTPMEQDYPAICAWTRHQTVSTKALREELERALEWVNEADPPPNPYHPGQECVNDDKGQCTTSQTSSVTVERCKFRITMGHGDIQQCERPADGRHVRHTVEDYYGHPLVWLEDSPRCIPTDQDVEVSSTA